MTPIKELENVLPDQRSQVASEIRENQMARGFWQKAEQILASPDFFRKNEDVLRVGLEVEVSLLDKDLKQASENQRNAAIHRCSGFSDTELGASQFEWRTDPVALLNQGVASFVNEFTDKERQVLAGVRIDRGYIVSCGFNPLVPIPLIVRTTKEKYQQVPNFHNRNKSTGLNTVIGDNEKVDVADAAVIALANSIQCNVEATDFQDAIDKLNRSFAIGPCVMAVCANARFLDLKDTGLADARMIAWEISHDTRTELQRERGMTTRIGLPGIYYQDMRDYFQRVSAHPFILDNPDNAFAIGVGLNWRDARIKFIGNSAVVEFRPVSVQPSNEENLASMLFYLGRLAYSCKTQEELMPLDKVRYNRDQAMRFGLKGRLWTSNGKGFVLLPAYNAVLREISLAEKGLEGSGLSEALPLLDLLKQRALKKETPSDILAESYFKAVKAGAPRNEALILALNEAGCLK